MYTYVHMHIHMYTYVYICTYAYTYVYIYMFHKCVYIQVSMYLLTAFSLYRTFRHLEVLQVGELQAARPDAVQLQHYGVLKGGEMRGAQGRGAPKAPLRT